MRIANLSLACVALVVGAWFALGARQARDLRAATAIVDQPSPPRAELAHAASLLNSAATLNPDLQVQLERALLAGAEKRPGPAEQIAEAAVRNEPRNVHAWYALARVAGRDQSTLFRALGEVNRLAPPPSPVR